jgi:uncharacterized membrane protein
VEVENTGGAALTNVATTVQGTAATVTLNPGCSALSLAAGGTKSCTATVTPTQNALDAGTAISLVANASATGLAAVQSSTVNVPALQNFKALISLSATPTYTAGKHQRITCGFCSFTAQRILPLPL